MAPLFKKKNATSFKGNDTKTTEETGKAEQTKKDSMVCPACKKELVKSDVKDNKYVCYECGN